MISVPRLGAVMSLLLMLTAGFGLGFWLQSLDKAVPHVALHESPSVQDCMRERISALKVDAQNISMMGQVLTLCGEQIKMQASLNDFQIRRLKFFGQYYAERISLWMVVIITVSGVLLAGLQLLASYKLAELRGTALAESAELSVEQSRLVVKSSVTGLMVLIVSFAFFLAFILYIYRIESIDPDGGRKPQGEPPPASLSGGLGPPPTAPKTQAPGGIPSP